MGAGFWYTGTVMTETSEPPKGGQVDDVLAAIRRLVSAEEQERRRAAPLRSEGSLILTSDMRIDGPIDRPAAPAPSEQRRMSALEREVAKTAPRPELSQDLTPALSSEDLADLVREIVREELQGELGERISANIRKLVRREISRAIATRMGN